MCDEGIVGGIVAVRIRRWSVGAEEKGLVDVWCRARFEKEGEGGEEVGRRGQEVHCGGKRG